MLKFHVFSLLTEYSHSSHVEDEIDPHQEHSCNPNLPLPVSRAKTLSIKHRCKTDSKNEERYFHPGVKVDEKEMKLANESQNFHNQSNDGTYNDNYSCTLDEVDIMVTQACTVYG